MRPKPVRYRKSFNQAYKPREHGYLPVLNHLTRENLIAMHQNHLIVNKSLYHPRLNPHQKTHNNKHHKKKYFYVNNKNYHNEKQRTNDFRTVLSKIQTQHYNKKKLSNLKKEPYKLQVYDAQPLIHPVVIDPVIQIDQAMSKYAFDLYLINKII